MASDRVSRAAEYAVDREAWSVAIARSEVHGLSQAPISRRGLLGQVVHAIGLKIISRELPPGTMLPNEADWCEQLGVSRTALREATKILISKGLIESRPKTGTRVRDAESWNLLDPDVLAWQLAAPPRERFIRELFEMRRMTEPAVASLAALRASPAHLGAMADALRGMEAAGDDGRKFIAPDKRFHETILNAVDNGLLRSLSGMIEMALTISMYQSFDAPLGQQHALPLHAAVYDAFQKRDPDAARAAMERLVDDAETDAFMALKMRRPTRRTNGNWSEE